jgi:hypothetical protein
MTAAPPLIRRPHVDPRRGLAIPTRCPACGRPVTPLLAPAPRPELVDAMGIQIKPGVGVNIKAGAGVIVADSTKPCCCTPDCGCPQTTRTASFSGVTLETIPNNPCCSGFVLYDFSGLSLGTRTLTLDQSSPGNCVWVFTLTPFGALYNNNSVCPTQTQGTKILDYQLVVSLQRKVVGGVVTWTLSASTQGGSVSGFFFYAQVTGSAGDCATPPSFTNSQTAFSCSLGSPGTANIGKNGTGSAT